MWSCFSAIQHLKLLLAGIPVHQETTTTETGALRLHHGQHSLGCDQGIHGMATSLEYGQGRIAGKGVGRHHNSLTRCRGNGLAAEISWLRIIAARWCSWIRCRSCAAEENDENQQQSTEHEGKAAQALSSAKSGQERRAMEQPLALGFH